MASKWNNSKLLIVFGVLVVIFLAVRYVNTSKEKGNFDPDIISVDTAALNEVRLYSQAAGGKEIRIFEESGQWMVQKGDFKVKAMASTISSLIRTLVDIKPERLAARSRDKWEKYQVTDSAATKVALYENGENTLTLLIGKFSYKQSPSQNPYGQQRGRPISYFRIEGADEVYATDGFLNMSFNRDFNSFRDQTFLKAEKASIRNIDIRMPMDSGYTLQLIDSTWMLNDKPAVQDEVDQLLNSLAMNNQNQFADEFEASGQAPFRLRVEGNNTDPIEVMAYNLDSANVIMRSSLNPEAFFKVPRSDLFSRLFRPQSFYTDTLP